MQAVPPNLDRVDNIGCTLHWLAHSHYLVVLVARENAQTMARGISRSSAKQLTWTR